MQLNRIQIQFKKKMSGGTKKRHKNRDTKPERKREREGKKKIKKER